MASAEEEAAYDDFVKREEENFAKIKGESVVNHEEFIKYQRTVMAEKNEEINVLRKKIDLSNQLSKEDMSEQARQKAQDANPRNVTEIGALLEDTQLRLRMVLSLIRPQVAFHTVGRGESSGDAEGKGKGES